MDRINTQFNDHRDFLEIPKADYGKMGMTNYSCTLRMGIYTSSQKENRWMN
jgi:hypothetical protein